MRNACRARRRPRVRARAGHRPALCPLRGGPDADRPGWGALLARGTRDSVARGLGPDLDSLLVEAGEVEAILLDIGERERVGRAGLIEAPRCLAPDHERVLGAVAHGSVEADSPRLA